MKLKFYIDYKEKLIARGKFFIIYNNEEIAFEYDAMSGGWGKGALPEGRYKVISLLGNEIIQNLENKRSYSIDGFGWFCGLQPLFATERTELGIHPDGGVEGSLGCIVMRFKCLDDNIRCYNLLRDGFEQGTMFLDVLFTGRQA